jgi:glycosyltransferase involved in cell wall biosynthesis
MDAIKNSFLNGDSMRIGVAHPGTQHSWQTSYAFQQCNLLDWYATGFYYKKTYYPDRLINLLPRIVSEPIEKELYRRRFDLINDKNIRRGSTTELIERQIGKLLSKNLQTSLIERRHKNFPKHLAKVFNREPVDVIWGPHDGLRAIKKIKSKNDAVRFVLDLPIGHFAKLNEVMAEEYKKNPSYFVAKPEFYSEEKVKSLNEALHLADDIVVGNQFVADTLDKNLLSKTHIIGYGCGEITDSSEEQYNELDDTRPIQFVFVGTVEPRKGIAYLIEAFRFIDPALAKLTIVGPQNVPDKIINQLPPSIDYVGQVLRSEVNRYLDQSDCFVFPSLFEGAALVVYEAAGRGLPIIQTKNTDIVVEHNKSGILLEHPENLTQEIKLLIADRNKLRAFKKQAKAKGYKRSWDDYREEICRFALEKIQPKVDSIINGNH